MVYRSSSKLKYSYTVTLINVHLENKKVICCRGTARRFVTVEYLSTAALRKIAFEKSLDFVINRFFMKLFRTSNIDTVKTCQLQFIFDLPSVIIEKRAKNLNVVLLKLNTRILTTFEIFGAAGIALCTLLFTFVI